ncbi:MAG: hypothetical protein GXC70_05305 [Sphingomonadaceae bacterium]|nr:hypothetical protein [Sphingomonadaceae bacterium]
MTVRLASARPVMLAAYLPPARLARLSAGAANDNGDDSRSSDVLRDGLLHFARFGLGAASDARNRARQCHHAGDQAGYRHWLAICRVLDRRMAAALKANLARRSRR